MTKYWLVLPLLVCSAIAADLPRKAPELSIGMNSGKPVLLSEYKGKVVAMCFILTTCPHCQKTIGFLIKDQQQYGARGFQVLASAIQDKAAAAVPGFIKSFNPPFPVGFNDAMTAINFMQHPPMIGPHMPMLAFLDKQGNIRAQYEGDNEQFFGDQQERNLRTQIENLLNETPQKAAPKKTAPPRKTTTESR